MVQKASHLAIRDSTGGGGMSGVSEVVQSFAGSAPSSAGGSAAGHRCSREDMANHVPDEYADALLDDEYMERLVVAMDMLNKKRRSDMDRYMKLNVCILYTLIVQAVLGVLIAIYKTLLMPTYNFSMEANLEDVDMVLMLDASNHIGEEWPLQHESVMNFSRLLFDKTQEVKEEIKHNAWKSINETKLNNTPWLARMLGIEVGGTDGVTVNGGRLRMATGLFNSESTFVHNFTDDFDKQKKWLASHRGDSYSANAMWHLAMSECERVIRMQERHDRAEKKDSRRQGRCSQSHASSLRCEDFHGASDCPQMYCDWLDGGCKKKKPLCRKQYCVIIGDSDALCRKRGGTNHEVEPGEQRGDDGGQAERPTWERKADAVCSRLEQKDLCPEKEERDRYGSPLEWASEIEDCKVKAKEMNTVKEFKRAHFDEQLSAKMLNQKSAIELIMMFTVPTDAERQMRLANTRFREFIKETMECSVKTRAKTFRFGGLSKIFDEYYVDNEGPEACLRFMMETSLTELMQKAENTAKLLESEYKQGSTPNSRKDPRFLFFLLCPLNLLFYLGWTKLVKMYCQTEKMAKRAAGMKKKMIKVTKTLVEKAPDSLPQMLPEFRELELAEIEKMKQPVEFGIPLSIRARLKGGYVRDNKREAIVDGHGHPFEQQSAWTFEAVGSSAELGQETALRIRNAKGQYLSVDENGSSCVGQPDAGGSTDFTLVRHNDEEDGEVCMGDVAHVRCLGTGKFLRVHKDGRIDGFGDKNQPETQVVIDAGGMPIASGSIITLRNASMGEFMHGSPAGEVRLGSDDAGNYTESEWRYWLVEKKDSNAAGNIGSRETAADVGGSLAIPTPSRPTTSFTSDPGEKAGHEQRQDWLREGDVVTLKAFNQNMLKVDLEGKVTCDTATGAMSASSAAGSSQPPEVATAELTQDFIVHRVGVSTVTMHNNTIRRGAQICLKPVLEDLGPSCYLRADVDESGLAADGTLSDRDISFTIDVASIQNVVTPLSAALQKGDADVAFTPLWNKQEVKHVEALSAAYTTDESLEQIKGTVVVAGSAGTYTVPRGGGNWVGVVSDGVDLFKAAKQAKAHGATGLIVRCENACSLDRLALGSDGTHKPDLPIVFVNEAGAESLNERGLVLKGCEFRKKYITDVMRAIGRAGAPQTRGHQANVEVFETAGRAMLERQKEWEQHLTAEAEREAVELAREVEEREAAQANFNWKVNANTHYYWSGGGGGAAAMKVNYGAKAPPSAHKDEKFDKTGKRMGVDAGYDRKDVNRDSLTGIVKRTRLSVTAVSAADVRDMRLAQELQEVLTVTEGDQLPQEELPEESDFKIEYKFEEIEVGVDENAEDVEEEEFFDDEGAVIATVGVPKKKFWIVAVALGISTLALTLFLIGVMCWEQEDDSKDAEGMEAAEEEQVTANSFLHPVTSGLAALATARLHP